MFATLTGFFFCLFLFLITLPSRRCTHYYFTLFNHYQVIFQALVLPCQLTDSWSTGCVNRPLEIGLGWYRVCLLNTNFAISPRQIFMLNIQLIKNIEHIIGMLYRELLHLSFMLDK